MSVTGMEKLEFGVEDLTHCAKFMRDFGLTVPPPVWVKIGAITLTS